MKNWAKRLLSIFPIFLIPAFLACSGATGDSMPVSLPVPFSGALDGNSRVVVADGQPIHFSSLAFSSSNGKAVATEPSGDQWVVFNSDGSTAGTVSYTNISPFTPVGNSSQFSFNAIFRFADGSVVECGGVTCSDFFYNPLLPPENKPAFDAPQCKGTCTGVIRMGTGIYANSRGNVCAHRYVYENKVSNGVRTFGAIDQGVWVIQK